MACMFQYKLCVFAIATIIIQLVASSADASNDCHIEGLPSTVQKNGQIIIHKVREGAQFRLQCACPLHTPMWNISYLKDWNYQHITGPVWCSNNSKVCNPPELSFILDPMVGLYTIINLTVTIDQTTILMCYRTSRSIENPDQLLLVEVEPVEEPTIPSPAIPASSVSQLPASPSRATFSMPHLLKSLSSHGGPIHLATSSSNIMPSSTSHLFPTTSSTNPTSPDVIDQIGTSLSSFAPYLLIILVVLLAVIVALIIGIVVIKYKNSKSRRGKRYCLQEHQVSNKNSVKKSERNPSPETLSAPATEMPSAIDTSLSQDMVMDVTKEEVEAAMKVIRAVSLQASSSITITRRGDGRSPVVVMSCSDLPGLTSSLSSTSILDRPSDSRLAYRHKKLSTDTILSSLTLDSPTWTNKSTTV